MRVLIILAVLYTASLASQSHRKAPAITIRNGTIIGSTDDGIDNYLGIPYAKPPVGCLRLRPPQSIDKHFGMLKLPQELSDCTACIQMDQSTVDTSGLPKEAAAVQIGGNYTGSSGEDCLKVNIQRPSGTKRGSKLPVLFWIHGGGFEIGTGWWYDGSAIINQSLAMKQPIMVVAVNYRLNAYGFLHGEEMQEAGATNLGLRDQRKALEWVAENIAAFGGDPNKVTIWGESAGGISVFNHLIINKGDHSYHGRPLFHGGIMSSGSLVHTLPTTSAKAQRVFNSVASAAGCDPTHRGKKTMSCLRHVSAARFTRAMNTMPDYSSSESNNLAYLPRIDPANDFYSEYPEVALAKGHFARVPIIAGNMEDEATPFAVQARHIVNSSLTLVDYIASWFPDTPRELMSKYIATYPDDPAAGLPARTGSRWELYPQYKRNAAIQTDIDFIAGRREMLRTLSGETPSWSFLGTWFRGFPQFGTYHTADLDTQWFSERANKGSRALTEAYVRFANHGDPNGGGPACDAWWPRWDKESLQMANFSASGRGLTRDDFRWESIEFYRKHGPQMRL